MHLKAMATGYDGYTGHRVLYCGAIQGAQWARQELSEREGKEG
jgi:hypothetical protein